MEKPINKQAALGMTFGPGERSFNENEPTQFNSEALRTRPAATDRLQKAEEQVESKHRAFELAAKKHGFPFPPEDPAGRVAWAEEVKRCAGSIKSTDERSFMLLLLWVREVLGQAGAKPKASVEVKRRHDRPVRR